MAEIVNLRSVRKQKARADKAKLAEENRRLHGRSKSERRLETAAAARLDAHLDGHLRRPKTDSDA